MQEGMIPVRSASSRVRVVACPLNHLRMRRARRGAHQQRCPVCPSASSPGSRVAAAKREPPARPAPRGCETSRHLATFALGVAVIGAGTLLASTSVGDWTASCHHLTLARFLPILPRTHLLTHSNSLHCALCSLTLSSYCPSFACSSSSAASACSASARRTTPSSA